MEKTILLDSCLRQSHIVAWARVLEIVLPIKATRTEACVPFSVLLPVRISANCKDDFGVYWDGPINAGAPCICQFFEGVWDLHCF